MSNDALRFFRFSFRRLILLSVNVLVAPSQMRSVQRVRAFLLRLIGFRIGENSQLSEYLYVHNGRNFRAGKNCRLGSFCRIWDFSPITIGNDCLASHGLTLISGNHSINADRTNKPGPISIGNNVWLGINVTIIGPAAIGDDVIVGANSLVTGDLLAHGIYGGSPARLIRMNEKI